jgi:hypothetical protein
MDPEQTFSDISQSGSVDSLSWPKPRGLSPQPKWTRFLTLAKRHSISESASQQDFQALTRNPWHFDSNGASDSDATPGVDGTDLIP